MIVLRLRKIELDLIPELEMFCAGAKNKEPKNVSSNIQFNWYILFGIE